MADAHARPEALSIYEFLIALDLEVSTAWKRRKTVPAVLLLTIRWVMLVNAVSTFVPTPSYTVRISPLPYSPGDLTVQTGVNQSLLSFIGAVLIFGRCMASVFLAATCNLVGFAQAARTSYAASLALSAH